MENKKKSAKSIIHDLNYENIKQYSNEDYYFQDQIEELAKEQNEIPIIIEKFLYSYLARVSRFCDLSTNENKEFINWYNTIGKEKLLVLFDKVCYEKIKVDRLIKIFTNYDVLLEQAVDENDVDCLLDVLIDIPTSIYEKMIEWNCLKTEDYIYKSKYFETYKSSQLNIEFINMPAEMQVSLL